MDVSPARVRAALATVFEEQQLLPASLTRGASNAEMLAVRLATPSGRLLFASGEGTEDRLAAREEWPGVLGGGVLTAAMTGALDPGPVGDARGRSVMGRTALTVVLVVFGLLAVTAYLTLFTVYQTQQALVLEFGKPKLPRFPLPDGFADGTSYLQHLTLEGAKERWGTALTDDIVDRLTYELKTIDDMGFSSYFLIVWDLIRHAREAGIRVGPGRGSAAGCAVAYTLWITDLDPIEYDLLFERFLNPSRISMPDIDMDFDTRYRDEMIRYAAERYGRDHVAQIVTFSTIKARAAVRDAARVLGYPYIVGDKVAKAMPPLVMGRDTPLYACLEEHEKFKDGYKMAAELRQMYETDADVKRVVVVGHSDEHANARYGTLTEGLKKHGIELIVIVTPVIVG